MKTIIIILLTVFMLGMFADTWANGAEFVVNGCIAAWGFVEMSKAQNKDVKWYVGVTASIFTLRAIYGLVKDL